MHRHNDHPHGDGSPRGRAALSEELVHHLPFSVSAVAIGLTLAGMGILLPITAAALHVVGSFIVVFNSARLVRFGEELAPYAGSALG